MSSEMVRLQSSHDIKQDSSIWQLEPEPLMSSQYWYDYVAANCLQQAESNWL